MALGDPSLKPSEHADQRLRPQHRSQRAGRFYERKGLLRKPPRSGAGYRQYDDGDVEIVRTDPKVLVRMKAFLRLALALSAFVACEAAAAEAVFVRLAEGFTSRDRQVGIVATQRIFSVPTLEETCAPLQPPARLVVVAPEPVRLVRGHWFSYDRLVVLAIDSSGRVLPPVPIVVEVEEITPQVLNLRSDMNADPDGKVLPVRAGGFRFRLRTICEGPSAVVLVRAEVVEP